MQEPVLQRDLGGRRRANRSCSKYFFSTSWNNDQLHEAGGELANQMKLRNVYLMAPNYQAGKDAKVRSALKKADFQSVRGDFSFNTNQFPAAPFYRVDVVKDKDGNPSFASKGMIFARSQDSFAGQCAME